MFSRATPEYVGGISRTVNYKGFHFDIGGHRFFSKSREVEDLWTEIAGDDMLDRPRSSRIYYRGQFFTYPLKPFEALSKLGLVESVRCVLSFLAARLRPTRNPKTFEDWVTNQFGKRLFRIFFKTYTEKVWGMSCNEISADWAAQRIKGLSLGSAIKHALFAKRKPERPQAGGEDADRHLPLSATGTGNDVGGVRGKSPQAGRRSAAGPQSSRLPLRLRQNLWIVTARNANGELGRISRRAPDLVHADPGTGGTDRAAASRSRAPGCARLRYRDFLTVGLIVHDRGRFNDNWIYIHDPSVQVGRVQNYKSWSPEMVPDPAIAPMVSNTSASKAMACGPRATRS